MKHRVALTLVLLAVPALLGAQSTPSKPAYGLAAGSVEALDGTTSKTVYLTIDSHAACPVGMRAKQGSGAGLVAVRKEPGQPDTSILSNKPGQQIHLILGKISGGPFSDFSQIASATITARGLSARGRIDNTPAVVGNGPTADLHRTFDANFSKDSDGTLYADLSLPGFTSVQSIRIDSLKLKDGSTWTIDSKQGCVVAPDPLMLIAAH